MITARWSAYHVSAKRDGFAAAAARLPLGEWIERNVLLPQSLAATPGPMRLWTFQRELGDSIGDPNVERASRS
jgi:hypothetical protein